MKKTILLILILVFIVLALTGCATVEYNLKINKDKTGEVEYTYGLDKSVIASLGTNPEDATSDMRKRVEENGYTVEPYEDNAFAGFKATKVINDVTEENILKEMFGEEYIDNVDESKIKITKTLFGTKYKQNATVNLESMQSLSQITVNLKYSLTLPTKVSKTNADEISKDGKNLVWQFKAGETREIYFKADSGRILKIIILVIMIVIIIVTIIISITKKIKKPNKSKKKEE